MPERSSTSPISVKNGTASSVSLATMPNTRCGSAWNSDALNSPSSMPTRPYRMPLAASANATGKPSSKNTTSVPNMIGARFAMKNSMRSEEHTSELQSLMRNSYAVFGLKKKTQTHIRKTNQQQENTEQDT